MDREKDTARKEVILLVDDEQDHLIITRRFLESQGYDCVCVDRGWEALRVLGEQPVDLILLDLHMPGMDGYCLAENILARDQFRKIWEAGLFDGQRVELVGGTVYLMSPIYEPHVAGRPGSRSTSTT